MIITPRYRFTASKNIGLTLVLLNSMQYDRPKPFVIFISGKLFETGAGINERHTSLGYGIKI